MHLWMYIMRALKVWGVEMASNRDNKSLYQKPKKEGMRGELIW